MIEIEELSKHYGDVRAVDNISLSIKPGEVLGLLGPNGAGKSSTMRMLTGYMPPTSGTIRVKGIQIDRQPIKARQLMGYLPESAPLYPDMLVYDYLVFVAGVRGIKTDEKLARIRKVAAMCGIAEVMHKNISELSRGYRQRVGLAHAMITDPEILVLDEPTSGLDPNQIIEIREIIKSIGREKTVIFSTHILSEAEATCDRIVIIHEGKIVADGPSEELRRRADDTQVIHVALADVDFSAVKQELEKIHGVKKVEKVNPAGTTADFKVTCSPHPDPRVAIYTVIRDRGWMLLEFHSEARSLETIFRQLTQGAAQ